MLAYRILLTLAAPILGIWMLLRLFRQAENLCDLRQRLGIGRPGSRPAGKLLWLHGASNGELTSARGLIEALLARDPALGILVTANSVTGRDMVLGWYLPRLDARLAPLDYRFLLARFLDAHAPDGMILLEGDLWPNRFETARRCDLPVAMVSARISGGSFRKWSRFGGLGRQMMRSVGLLSAQDADSERRFLQLGLPETALRPGLTLKSSVRLAPPAPEALAPFASIYERDETLLVASTHEGEEAPLLEAFAKARETRPTLKMILAPRHRTRGDDVWRLVESTGLPAARRSLGQMPRENTAIYLADTMGEMALWYRLAGMCFVGGSLVDKGGHTPFEPAQFNCAILHGSFLSNFADPYSALDAVGGAVEARDSEAVTAALLRLDAAECRRMALAARAALALDNANGLDTLIDALAELFDLAGS